MFYFVDCANKLNYIRSITTSALFSISLFLQLSNKAVDHNLITVFNFFFKTQLFVLNDT